MWTSCKEGTNTVFLLDILLLSLFVILDFLPKMLVLFLDQEAAKFNVFFPCDSAVDPLHVKMKVKKLKDDKILVYFSCFITSFVLVT